LVSLLGAERMDCFSVSFLYLGAALRAGTGPLVFRPEDAKRLQAQSDDGEGGRRLSHHRLKRLHGHIFNEGGQQQSALNNMAILAQPLEKV
jgi:hypothetical protein